MFFGSFPVLSSFKRLCLCNFSSNVYSGGVLVELQSGFGISMWDHPRKLQCPTFVWSLRHSTATGTAARAAECVLLPLRDPLPAWMVDTLTHTYTIKHIIPSFCIFSGDLVGWLCTMCISTCVITYIYIERERAPLCVYIYYDIYVCPYRYKILVITGKCVYIYI